MSLRCALLAEILAGATSTQEVLLQKILMKLGMPTEDAQVMVRNPCDLVWQNFQCDGQGQITGLAFMGMASPGQVPAELAQLQHLRYIHLRGNSLSREILRELGELQNLQELLSCRVGYSLTL